MKKLLTVWWQDHLTAHSRYKSFKQVLSRIQAEGVHQTGTLPVHENIRGKGFYK